MRHLFVGFPAEGGNGEWSEASHGRTGSKGRHASLRPSEQKVASFFLAHAGELESLTIGELASAAGVSEPTVIRCVRGLGYRGYRAFKGALRGRGGRERRAPLTIWGASPSGPGTGWRTCR